MNQSSSSYVEDSPFIDPDEVAAEERPLQGDNIATTTAAAYNVSEIQDIQEPKLYNRPRAPLLKPTIPGLSSTVSSLSGSAGVSTTQQLAQSTPILSSKDENFPSELEVPMQNQTLIQMLNLVGNRFLEAEGNGMLPLQQEEQQVDDPMYELPDETDDNSADVQIKKRSLLDSIIDEENTPRGGRSPMTSSVANIAHSSRIPASRRLASQTASSSSSSDSPFGSQELHPDHTANHPIQPLNAVVSSTDSSQSDVSTSGMQVSIHALSTAKEPASGQLEQLTDRLKLLFSLDKDEEIISCHPCWLFRGVLLQGYIYILTSHVCFYAYLPSREDKILKAGVLRKKTKRTHRFSRHWAVLRGRSLSWYESNRDPYFPQDHIDLRNVLSVNVQDEGRFTVETPERVYVFEADSEEGAQDWVNVLKRSVFRAQNEGESVRISIPFEVIVDVDGSDASPISRESAGQGQDMVSIKVVNSSQSQNDYSMDEYFFLNLANPSTFVEELRANLVGYVALHAPKRSSKPIVRDTTSSLTSATTTTQPISIPMKKPSDIVVTAAIGLEAQLAEAVALSSTPTGVLRNDAESSNLSTSVKTIKSLSSSIHSYPPSSTIISASTTSLPLWERKSVLPQWVKEASSRLSASESWLNFASKIPGRSVHESWSVPPFASSRNDGEEKDESLSNSTSSLFSVLEAPEREGELLEADAVRQFRDCFSLPDEEKLLGHLSASLYRVLPVTGRLYISTNYICFRSSRLASKAMGRTLMILPKNEIISIAKNNAFRYGQHGLVIIVRGHEELFLEFASSLRRDQSISLIDMQLKSVAETSIAEAKRREGLLLTDLGQRLSATATPMSPLLEGSLKLFNSASSAFLSSKPKENMHITFLTIGSRGDVQPYIALAKGLKQEGHSVRIATHKEFEAWIESYNIEFREVGGDPAELMKICVDNGTFTMAFLRESMTKFRGWLDDLLISCWKACQGTDVIVESPSAIAGIHVAEALQIPYYRSFTMPWTRTRVYPHAFAVPGHKAGGNYNYMSYVIFDQVFWRASAGQINSWRRECLGLKPTSLDKLEQHKVPFLYNFSPYLVPKPIDWYDWIHVTGFWFLDHADESGRKEWTPPADLVDFIASVKRAGRKLVYIGWGSIVVPDAEAMTKTVLQAVEKSGVSAILSKGWSDRLQVQSVTTTKTSESSDPNVFSIQSIPHDWLFPQLDAACHHGGSGTLGASLRAGIPTIVKPYFGDQFFWASQVENLHIGTSIRNFTVDTFAQALQLCTSDVKMIENANKIGEVIRAEDGVGNAIKAFYGDWDYACSRIPRGGSLTLANAPNVKGRAAAKIDLDQTKRDSKSRSRSRGSSSAADVLEVPSADEQEVDDDGLDGWSVVSGSEGHVI